MLTLLTQLLPLLPTLVGSISRFVSERASTSAQSEGQTFRQSLAMSEETAQKFNATLAKARAMMGGVTVQPTTAAGAHAVDVAPMDAPPLTVEQIDEMILLLGKIKAELPAHL